MGEVETVLVDARDISWEDPRPRFRVYLHGSGATSTGGWTATYDVVGADVLQVIDWAQRRAEETLTYAIALVRDDEAEAEAEGGPAHGRGLVWLIGMDGNDVTTDPREAETQQRMLARGSAPVGIPAHDRMPGDIRP